LRKKGVLIGMDDTFANVRRIQPPFTISKDELRTMVDRLKEVMES